MSESLTNFGPATLSLLLGILFSLSYASLYHLWIGRSGRDLILFVLMSFFGFGIGHIIGALLRIDSLQIGQLHIVEGSVGSWLAMVGVKLFYADR